MNISDFNILKQTVNELSPRQKNDLEKHLLNLESKALVLKLLEKTLSGCPHCQYNDAYNSSFGVHSYHLKSVYPLL